MYTHQPTPSTQQVEPSTPPRYFPHQVPNRHEPHELIVDLWALGGFLYPDGEDRIVLSSGQHVTLR